MRTLALVVTVAWSLVGCESKTPASKKPAAEPPGAQQQASVTRAPLVDLTATSTLASIRTAFNASKGHARFLTLLSPT